MNRERVLQIVLVIAGLMFVALSNPLTLFFRQEPALAMMFSVYVTLGIFLLLAARNPSANRSLIAFTAWSSVAHASLMVVQVFRNIIERRELIGVILFMAIGLILMALIPGRLKSVSRQARSRLFSKAVINYSGSISFGQKSQPCS